MIGGGANRDQLLSSTSSSGGVAYSTPQSAQTAYNEAIQRHAVTAAFRAVQRATTRAEAEIRYVDLQMERATANAMANGNIQVDRVPIVNSSATTTQVTTKNLDSFTDRPSIVQSDPIVVKVQTVKQDNNNPIIDDPIVNYAGIGEFQDVTAEVGLGGLTGTHGVLFQDYDADGLDDLLVMNSRTTRLFRNIGGVFVDDTQHAGLIPTQSASGAHWEDLEKDGVLDLVLFADPLR